MVVPVVAVVTGWWVRPGMVAPAGTAVMAAC